MNIKILMWLMLHSFIFVSCSKNKDAKIGLYINGDQQLIITKSGDDNYRYRNVLNGRSGRLYPLNEIEYQSGYSWSAKEPAYLSVKFKLDEKELVSGVNLQIKQDEPLFFQKSLLNEEYIKIAGSDGKLSAKIVFPAGDGPFPVMLLAQPSGHYSIRDVDFRPYLFAANGIASMVFDKRGTGASEGSFSENYHKLAEDLVAAAKFLKSHPKINKNNIGLAGFGQGGVTSALAAQKDNSFKCLLIGYSPTISPQEEDIWENVHTLSRNNIPAGDQKDAEVLIKSVHLLVQNDLQSGWDEFKALEQKYQGKKWLEMLDEPASVFLSMPAWVIKLYFRFNKPDLIFDYQPLETLLKLKLPVLWLHGGDDKSMPPEKTLQNLNKLLNQNPETFQLQVFPGTIFGILKSELHKGKKIYSGHPPEYFKTMVTWSREQFQLKK